MEEKILKAIENFMESVGSEIWYENHDEHWMLIVREDDAISICEYGWSEESFENALGEPWTVEDFDGKLVQVADEVNNIADGDVVHIAYDRIMLWVSGSNRAFLTYVKNHELKSGDGR